MSRAGVSFRAVAVLSFAFAGQARAQQAPPPSRQAPRAATTVAADSPEAAILQALASNPVTSPYRFTVARRDRQFALAGKVGTRQVHDAAVQTVIALGYPVRDDLTIDTAESYRVAAYSASAGGYGGQGAVPFVYPPPLFGRLDDPFFGFEPPLVANAPWFGATRNRELLNLPPAGNVQQPGAVPPPLPGPGPVPAAGANGPLPDNTVEMTIDPLGNATIRGRVPTLVDRVAVGQQLARMPGVAQVVNQLEVGGPDTAVPASQVLNRPADIPPPPPVPAGQPVPPPLDPKPNVSPNGGEPKDVGKDAQGAAIKVEGDALSHRVADAIGRRPKLATLPFRIAARDGVVTLTGQMPSALEAMQATRAAQQTPGVNEVVDRLEYPFPEVDGANPLRDKGRPEDIEPYLLGKVRRQLGDLAHVETVRVRGDALEVSGTLARKDDQATVEAALRSIPLLRGFKVEPHFDVD